MKIRLHLDGLFFRLLTHWPELVWALLCVSGFSILAVYAHTPGPQLTLEDSGDREAAYPEEGARVNMFIHPNCACSKASLVELKEVNRLTKGQIDDLRFYVMVSGTESSGDWREEALFRQLQRWGNRSTVYLDRDGVAARRHGALTSGHVVAYNANGEQIFAGGITGSRGHRGDNPGRRQLVKALTGAPLLTAPSPVFGCELQSSEEAL